MKIASKILSVVGTLLLSINILCADLGDSPTPEQIETAISERLPAGVTIENARPNHLTAALGAVADCNNIVAAVDALTAANPNSAVALTLSASIKCPQSAAEIAGVAATNSPGQAVGIARAAAAANPRLVDLIALSVGEGAPNTNTQLIREAAIEGAANAAVAGATPPLPELNDPMFDSDVNNPSPSGL